MNIANLLELSRRGTELVRLLHLGGILLKKITTFASLLGLRGLVVALGEDVGQGAEIIRGQVKLREQRVRNVIDLNSVWRCTLQSRLEGKIDAI